MKKSAVVIGISLVVISSQCYASNLSKVETRISVNNGTTDVLSTGLITKYFATGATQEQTISLPATTFTALTIPSGAKGIFIDVGSSTNMILKGVTGDKGISLDATCPVLCPLSLDGSSTVGINNLSSSAQSVTVYYF